MRFQGNTSVRDGRPQQNAWQRKMGLQQTQRAEQKSAQPHVPCSKAKAATQRTMSGLCASSDLIEMLLLHNR
eukprot:6050490-Amphidinium_carterae.1